ncbi:B- and T-lymphocyte attenuator-like [Anabas testudineus]|uniref:B- and T-lymphocyte attenuator-like n=1 Tax=Anabas testudineus TaxID=64144 RepID=UPI000E45DDEA|nr:B- and T-lymphocyte attenuator-like [Anabas testudineus]
MSPNQCWIILHVSILAGLLFTLNADSEDSKCETEIKVRRNTIFKAVVGQELRINCTVVFCNNSVSWYKVEKTAVPVNISNDSHIKTDWKSLTNVEGISFLMFRNILSSDSGLYGCQSGGSVSHTINVSVHDIAETTTDLWNNTTTQTTNGNSEDDKDDLWMYIYCAAGIVGFVVLVIIISVISMQGCKGKSKKKTQTDNQYMEFPWWSNLRHSVRPEEVPRPHPLRDLSGEHSSSQSPVICQCREITNMFYGR